LNGNCEFNYHNGSKFIGEFKSGLKNGKGNFMCAEYDYDGEWE